LNSASLAAAKSQYPTNPFKVKYDDLLSSTGARTTSTFDSDFFSDNVYAAIVGCQSNNNITFCEKLANLCVLQMYDQSSVACAAYIKIAQSRPILSSSLYDR
jgi:hypothetical protein